MMDSLVSQIALDLTPGVGIQGAKQLISYCGSAEAVLKTPKAKLLKIPGVGEKLADCIIQSQYQKEAEQIIKQAQKVGASILHYTHEKYPDRLKHALDAPNLIYTLGEADLSPKRSVAIVGTRKATDYGKKITDQIVEDLRQLEVTVVSGLAYGIDIQAHKACLEHKMPNFAVLAGGIDRIYPSAHKKYASQIIENGALITESIPGVKPDRHLFPARNRIIAGMTDATIVVEAAEKGGALITAQIADSYNKAVFAVPGNVGNPYSEGTNKLIGSQKALIYNGPENLMYNLGWDIPSGDKTPPATPDLPPEELKVYTLLKDENKPIEIDLISIKTQIPINKVASTLLNLEFQNLVRSLPGKKFGLK